MTVSASVSVARRAAAGAGWVIAWRVVSRNVGLVSTLILVHLLQPSDFGLIALATGFINSVDALSALGVQEALVRAPAPDRDMYDTGFSLALLRGLATAAIIAAIAWPVGAFFEDPRLGVVMLALSAGTVITAFENIGIVDFRRDLTFRKEFDMQLWSRVAGVVTTVVVAVAWQSYWALVAGIIVYRSTRLAQTYLMSPYRPRLTLRAWRKLIGFSLWSWAQTMLGQARDRSDNIVIGRILGAGQVGVFSIGAELGLLPVTEVVEPLNRALFSGFASLHAASEGLSGMFLGSVGIGCLVILPAGFGISMIADPMVRLALGTEWVTTVPIVQIMAVVGTTSLFSTASSTLLSAIGRPNVAFYLLAMSTAARVLLLLALVPLLGLVGAAVAVSAATILDIVAALWTTLPRIAVSARQLLGCVVRPTIATAAMILMLWQLDMAWTASAGRSAIEIGLDAAERSMVGAMCYAIVLLGGWMAAGRPDGAERHAVMFITSAWASLFGHTRSKEQG